jgi:UPF0755 protein
MGFWLAVICLGLFFLHSLQFLNLGGQSQGFVSLAGAEKETVNLEIKPGESFKLISDKLKKANLIRSETIFKLYSLATGQSHQLKPGKYVLAANISIPDLLKELIKGPPQISATIAPGMTLKEVDDKLSSLGVIEPGDLINFKIGSLKDDYPWLGRAESLEGFLFPDTYNFFPGADSDLVIKTLLDHFALKALPYFEDNDTLLKTINLASLLEKEVPDYSERRLVAGILVKRLSVNMPLQVDATLIYNKCAGRFAKCPALKEKDYKTDSLYNTYLHTGLPKTPICNPSFEAIIAALNPQESDYWYYLSDPETQKTIFSKTLDEHNDNRAIYLLR